MAVGGDASLVRHGGPSGARPLASFSPPTLAPMAQRLRVAPDCEIPLAEIDWSFAPSGGPGGQHANKAHTRAVARLDLAASEALTEAQRARLTARLGR